MICNTRGGRRTIPYAESTCQPAHEGPCPSCVGATIATAPVQLLATQPATSQEGEKQVFDGWTRDEYNAMAAAEQPAATPTPPTLSEDLREVERLREDVAFLLARSGQSGKFTFGGKRWTGVSSNALVSIAFGEGDEGLPSDSSDLAACYRAVMRLPTHRRTDAVLDHLEAGERYVEGKYPGSIEWAREDTEWPGRAALAQVKAS